MKLKPFLEPRHKYQEGTKIISDDKKYEKMIKGLNKRFWEVIYNGLSFEEVCRMTPDELLEAHAALRVLGKEMDKSMK